MLLAGVRPGCDDPLEGSGPQSPVQTSSEETLLGGRYQRTRQLSMDRSTEVWECRDLVLLRDVAVRILGQEAAANRGRDEAFNRQARSIARISQAGLEHVFDYGELLSEGVTRPYLVFELVRGEPLLLPGEGGAELSPAVVIEVVRQVALALVAVHRAGIVHGDVHPPKVIVRSDGVVKLTGLTIAGLEGGCGGTQDSAGEPGHQTFLPPELHAGEPPGPSSDIYSLGTCACQWLLPSTTLAGAITIDTKGSHLSELELGLLVRSLRPDIPGGFVLLLLAMLGEDPTSRPAARAVALACSQMTRVPAPTSAVATAAVPAKERSRITRALRLRR